MSNDRNPLRHQIQLFMPAGLLVVLAFVLAYQFIKPAPPDHVVMATGGPDGAYHQFGQRYAAYLAREGITLELRNTAGSSENLDLLRQGEVSLAFVQGGVDTQPSPDDLQSLGSLYYEPLWLFHRRDLSVSGLADLAGKRLAIGPEGSGTRALVTRLLGDNGLAAGEAWLPLGGLEAVEALISGQVDAAFFVIAADSEVVRRLLPNPDITLASFERAAAYSRRYRYLSSLELPEGVFDLSRNLPDRTIQLLAPTANLVADPDIHPAIVDLILQAAADAHRDGNWLAAPGEFPSPTLLAYPLSSEASRYYEHGPPFLQRFLPFWAASLVDRLKVMLLPLIVLMLPLIKVMPPVYHWRMRARIYRWYDELEKAELAVIAKTRDHDWLDRELFRIEEEVRNVKVPLSFTDQLYHLRLHIGLVRSQLLDKPFGAPPP